MKMHILIGAVLVLTLGSAVAGTLIYDQRNEGVLAAQASQGSGAGSISMWKATAAAMDYSAPRVPL